MILKQKEKDAITELQSQEKICVEKYHRYKEQAKDPELKTLFGKLEQEEQKHYDSLEQVLNGSVPACDCNDSDGANYKPQATYDAMSQNNDKQSDSFLATDCIGTEKFVSSEYNTNVFKFADAALRKLLADIQIEEQNHAEMLYKYKTANGMA
ncbi:MAG: ferritin-like domain-containing protein [Lachnospiraceae bacterium]|nr:ferritin-like domain-containing protein [Lachnospiraceae bacterium]MDE7266851.1 ferritin-like domain-containing protein [Lachnospiraceae bacterium]